MRKLLTDLFNDLRQLEQRIADVTREIEAIADREDAARRFMTIPGIGALGVTRFSQALEAADSSRRLEIWRRGWASCLRSTRPVASRGFLE